MANKANYCYVNPFGQTCCEQDGVRVCSPVPPMENAKIVPIHKTSTTEEIWNMLPDSLPTLGATYLLTIILTIVVFGVIWKSMWTIGPTEMGVVRKRWGRKKLREGQIVALNGEAGYQADLLTPGVRFKLWPWMTVERHPIPQIPAGQIGVVIAQVGAPLPMGAKSARYSPDFGNFQDLRKFMAGGGQRGVQRPVLAPGTVAAIHPVAFLVVTQDMVYGHPVEDAMADLQHSGKLDARAFGLVDPGKQLSVVRIEPMTIGESRSGAYEAVKVDIIGIVTTLEGDPSPSGAMANRLGDFADITALETSGKSDADLVETLLASKNTEHNNYQDFQKFLDAGGRIGLQHDPLLYGAYTLNPFLISVELTPMLVVQQGQVAVMKGYVGLATEDTSGADFKFGALVRPGHRGIWREPLRTGKYALNPRAYNWELVPTFILTLNWAEATSTAHNLDKGLSSIVAKSKEGFEFKIDLQVQIHVPDTEAPRVISTVGTMQNLVNEVLQAAVGNYFRDQLQAKPAIEFIEKRAEVQAASQVYIAAQLAKYHIETPGVYIQDVVFPPQLVVVLTARQVAVQQKDTYTKEKEAQDSRVELEKARGTADMQASLAKAAVGVDVAKREAESVQARADGEAYKLDKEGRAAAVRTEAEGLAVAKGLEAQQAAVGRAQAAIIAVVRALSASGQALVPVNLALGEGGLQALVPQVMGLLDAKAVEEHRSDV